MRAHQLRGPFCIPLPRLNSPSGRLVDAHVPALAPVRVQAHITEPGLGRPGFFVRSPPSASPSKNPTSRRVSDATFRFRENNPPSQRA